MKNYLRANSLRLIVAVALVAGLACGLIDPATAAIGMVCDTASLDLKVLEKAMKDAFDKMQDNLKRAQDTADKALEEVKQEGTLHGKTNEKLTELGESGKKLAADFGDLRSQVIEIAQKIAVRAPGSGSGEAEKSLFELVSESPQYKSAASIGRMEPVTVGNFHKHLAAMQRKTQIVNASGQDQPLVPDQRVAGIITPGEQRMYIRDLVPAARATSNLIQYVSEASYTNNARPQGDASPGNVEGEAFAESAFTFTLANAPLVTIGHSIPASRQILSDAAMLQGHLSTRLIYGLKMEEEQEFLAGDGTAGTVNGINNQAAAYGRGVTNDTILDTLLKGLLQVSLSNYEADGYVLHPVDWYTAMGLKDTTGRYLFSDPQSMVQPRVWAKPVVPSANQTQGRFTCGAFALGAQIWDLEDANVRISENVASQFVQNMVTLLAQERTVLVVYRTTAFVYGNTSHAG